MARTLQDFIIVQMIEYNAAYLCMPVKYCLKVCIQFMRSIC